MSVRWLPLALCFGLVGACAAAPDPGVDPSDDDSASSDDDSAADEPPAEVTFAATGAGSVEYGPEPEWVTTAISGEFQFLYWDADGAPACRTRLRYDAFAAWGPAAGAEFEGCAGGFTLWSAEPSEICDPPCDDPCDLPPELDLSFLVQPGEGAPATDFRTMAILRRDELDDTLLLGMEGPTVGELSAGFDAAGFSMTHLLLVRPEGWLADRAGLLQVARSWGDEGWLPMFAVYRAGGDPNLAPFLGGEFFVSSPWAFALAPAR